MSLVEFLNARLDGDDEVARNTTNPYWASRMLRDTQIKRQIIAWIERQSESIDVWWWTESVDPILQYMALAYKDHPDFDPDWSPDE